LVTRRVVDDGWSLRRAAERFQTSPQTAGRWAGRYRAALAAGVDLLAAMLDRCSRPMRSPGRVSRPLTRKFVHLRRSRGWGPARIGHRLGCTLPPVPESRWLVVVGLSRSAAPRRKPWLTSRRREVIYNQMVVRQRDPEAVDRVFAALADATRRDIVERVLRQEESVSSLARRYAMSFAAVQKHVAVLERASLVTKRAQGRERLVSGNVEAVQFAMRLLDEYEQTWRARVERIDDLLADDAEPGTG
jgi:DNA-binding transcriptional ArsR family regulator